MKKLALLLLLIAGPALGQIGQGYAPGPGCPLTSCPSNQLSISAGSSQALTSGAYNNVTMTASTTFTLPSNLTSGQLQTVAVQLGQDSTAGRVPTFSGSNIAWISGVTPTFNSAFGYYDIVVFTTLNGGTIWSGQLVGTFAGSAGVPGQPTGVTATAGNTQNVISASAQPGQPAVTGYNIYRGTTPGGEGGSPVASNVTLPYNDTSLSNGTTYYYTIAAVNSQGTGAQSAEINAAPSATAYGHYYTISSTGYFYTPHIAGYSPGSSTFTVECLWAPSSFTPASANKCGGPWGPSISGDSNSQYILYLHTTGAMGFNWEISGAVVSTTLSTVNPAFQSKVPLWVRADVTPTTGLVVFYTGPWVNSTNSYTAVNWTQLGATVTGTNPGAVLSPGSPYDLVELQGSGGGIQFTGDVYAFTLIINGTTLTCPVAGASSFSDSCGSKTYTASGGTFH